MVQRYRRGKGKQRALMGSHQRCWIWGRNAVLETLRAGRWPMYELHLADRLSAGELQTARDLAAAQGVEMHITEAAELQRLCRSAEHQGYAAKMPPFPYNDPERVLAQLPENPHVLVLDAVQDPYNFGAMLRSAEVLGVDAVWIGTQRQVGVNSLVARTSAGAVNHVPIARVDRLPDWLHRMRQAGIQTVAACAGEAAEIYRHDFTGPTALVIGNEGAGIGDELLNACDARVTIPQFGRVESLNAAVSAGILCYEVRRQRAQQQS